MKNEMYFSLIDTFFECYGDVFQTRLDEYLWERFTNPVTEGYGYMSLEEILNDEINKRR